MVLCVVGSILHGVDALSYFSFQPVLHDWCNKGHGMCYPVCGMVHIKEPLLLIGQSSPFGNSGFPFSLSVWSFTICMTPYNRKLSASLNKTSSSVHNRLASIQWLALTEAIPGMRIFQIYPDFLFARFVFLWIWSPSH